jgi:hypothetical protein
MCSKAAYVALAVTATLLPGASAYVYCPLFINYDFFRAYFWLQLSFIFDLLWQFWGPCSPDGGEGVCVCVCVCLCVRFPPLRRPFI